MQHRKFSIAVLAMALFALLGTSSAPAQADSRGCTVEAHNPHSSIQQAVDSGCSQIRVTPGTYHENVVIPAGDTVSITSVAGPAKTIVDGGGAGSVFSNLGGELTLTGLTIQNGNSDRGGGILNFGTLTLIDSTVTNNSAGTGGGIYSRGGNATLIDSIVTNNIAGDRGGGIFNGAGSLMLTNSAVINNTAGVSGGGIANVLGSVTLIDSTVSHNTAGFRGGGIYNLFGTLTLTNSSVTGNTPDDIFP